MEIGKLIQKIKRPPVGLILGGWLGSRFILTLIAWFTQYFIGNPNYPNLTERGFFLSPKWLIDIWCRWDSRWYLSIVQNGYSDAGTGNYSNIAFFPLYPAFVKALTFWLPSFLQTESVLLLVGLILSNLFFIASLFGIYHLAQRLFDAMSARRTIILLFCLPTSFYFSAFYTESLFLFVCVFAFIFAERKNWWAAAMFAALAALCRPNGILIAVPLVWIFFSTWNKTFKGLLSGLWFAFVPSGILIHFWNLQRISGNFFIFFESQSAWGRVPDSSFFNAFFEPIFTRHIYPSRIDFVFIFFAALVALAVTIKIPNKAYGIYALVSIAALIFTGNLYSMTRYTMLIFPNFILLGKILQKPALFTFLCALLGAVQTLYFCGWVNFYWIA